MLRKLTIRNFKSVSDVTVELPRLSLCFGANAAGKSNLVEAIMALSWIGSARTLADAFEPLRGYPAEAFRFGEGGWSELSHKKSAEFTLEAEIGTEGGTYRYRVRPQMDLTSGELRVADEHLTRLTATGRNPKNDPAAIERVGEHLHIRRRGKPSRPRPVPLGLPRSVLSDRHFAGGTYPWIEQVRNELTDWRMYYLDPRSAMRAAQPPADVWDIGLRGEHLTSFLYKLKALEPKHLDAVLRTLKAIVPNVGSLDVALNRRHGMIDVSIQQAGVEYPASLLSEGTLRVLALAAIVVNPWSGPLVAIEEPENGVHPRRIEWVARLLTSLALDQGRQVVVTTHSPLLCDAVLREAKSRSSDEVALFNVRCRRRSTEVHRFDANAPLFRDDGVTDGLTNPWEDSVFENLILRGWIDE